MRLSVGTLIWIVLLSICIGYEIWAWTQHSAEWPTFTRLVIRYVPAPVTLFFIVWLYFHFLVHYLDSKK